MGEFNGLFVAAKPLPRQMVTMIVRIIGSRSLPECLVIEIIRLSEENKLRSYSCRNVVRFEESSTFLLPESLESSEW